MARYTEAKCRLCRREGKKLFLKGSRCYTQKCPIDRKGALPPGQHGQKGVRRMSDYGKQLREKQKIKRSYGILERQLRIYYEEAMGVKGATGEALLQMLETRLDNLVYRLGLTLSRSIARQIVNHGQVLVDNNKVTIPSYRVKIGQVISLSDKAAGITAVKESLADKERKTPDWLERKANSGRIKHLPKRDEIDADFDENLVVEYYSR